MHASTRPRHAVALLVLLILSACAAPAAPTPAPTKVAAVTAALPTVAPSAMPPSLPTPRPTTTPSPTPAATATALPTATPLPSPTSPATPTPDPAVGLPCPDPAPVKPDYAAYALTAAPWPTADAAAALPPLSLANPLPNAGRNAGYPYGSDGSGRYLLHNGLDMADEDEPPPDEWLEPQWG